MNLGILMREYRLQHRITVKAMAIILDVKPAQLGRLERGQTVHPDAFRALMIWLLNDPKNSLPIAA